MKSFSDKTLDVIFNHLSDGYESLRQKHLQEIFPSKREKLHGDIMRTLTLMNDITTIRVERVMTHLLTFNSN
jgi:hypothetical protein